MRFAHYMHLIFNRNIIPVRVLVVVTQALEATEKLVNKTRAHANEAFNAARNLAAAAATSTRDTAVSTGGAVGETAANAISALAAKVQEAAQFTQRYVCVCLLMRL